MTWRTLITAILSVSLNLLHDIGLRRHHLVLPQLVHLVFGRARREVDLGALRGRDAAICERTLIFHNVAL